MNTGILLTQEQTNTISQIDEANVQKKDQERLDSNEKQPWKYNSLAFVDRKLHCYFSKGRPARLSYNSTDLGPFTMSKTIYDYMKSNYRWSFPEAGKINQLMLKNKDKDVEIILNPCISDGCNYGNTANLTIMISPTEKISYEFCEFV